jgi:hypothetical protein
MAVQILVHVTPKLVHLLPECLQSLKDSTKVDHVVNVVVAEAMVEERVGEIVATARSIYDRSGLVLTCCQKKLGYNAAVMEALRNSDFPYTLVFPCTHRMLDKEWFGKMQLPHIRAPGCGMTFAFDNIEPNTLASNPWNWRQRIESPVFMLSRNAIGTAESAPIEPNGNDLSNAIRDHLLTVAAKAWAVPSCRVVRV